LPQTGKHWLPRILTLLRVGAPLRVPFLSRDDVQVVSQVASGLGNGETMARGPEVEDIVLGATGSIEALKDVLMKSNSERSPFGARRLMNWARTTMLDTMTRQLVPRV
jgi:hypothetical protein